MRKKPKILTCYQVWKRYNNADKKSVALRHKWKYFVGELHDIEYWIGIVKDAIAKEYANVPDKSLGEPIPTNVQDKLAFLRQRLVNLTAQRKETHAIIALYKKECMTTTTQANRYKMAYMCIRSIAVDRFPADAKDISKFIDDFECSVITHENGRLDITVSDVNGENLKFRF